MKGARARRDDGRSGAQGKAGDGARQETDTQHRAR
jgi:hypothetical protein